MQSLIDASVKGTLSFLRFVPAVCAVMLAASGGVATAQEFPARPVRIVVGFPPGGITDITGRMLADGLSRSWGKQVLVDNRPGASGTIGADHVAKSSPDGYTLLITTSAANVVAPSLYRKMPYDADTAFAHITLLSSAPSVMLVNSKLPVKTLREFIDYCKARPGQVAFASPGNGLTGHLAVEMFAMAAGIRLLHVPYKGSGPALTATAAGETQMIYDPIASSIGLIRSGALRPLALSATERSPVLPDVPTMEEAGLKGIEFSTWNGLSAPAGTPREVIARIYRDSVTAMRSPAVREKLLALHSNVVTSASPEEFNTFVHSETSRWGDVIRKAHVRVE